MTRVRIGIDVGGTFTHAVALDSSNSDILGHSVVPTTHFASSGVAEGVVSSLKKLIAGSKIDQRDVTFIAHSTTQATNAILEGDVSKVGIIGVGKGIEGSRGKGQVNFGKIRISRDAFIWTDLKFLSAADQSEIKKGIKELCDGGSKAIVAAEAFSTDDPGNEDLITDVSRAMGIPAVATHDISGLYGLKARTRTAVLNASILPKMLEAAVMTDGAVKDSGISAELMVMRSDGGVLSLNEVKRRPILTILSGPAAGVAAALMYEKISYGIFLEVGGTSTDITAIRDGKAAVKSAEVGGNKLYLKTLDVRTVGLAGGSMPRAKDGKISDVGPRSAHIAGLPYACFSDVEKLRDLKCLLFSPKQGDPEDYVVLESGSGERFALTVTCAANALGLIKEGDWAFGDQRSAKIAVAALAGKLGRAPDDVAREIMDASAKKFFKILQTLISEYDLDKNGVFLVGGGGGASAIVPYLASKTGLPFRIAKNNPIISAIGVALAMLHETVERSVIDPTGDDIAQIRREAEQKVLLMGARPETVEVTVEVDAKRNVLRASAFGATEFIAKQIKTPGPADGLDIAAKSLGIPSQNVKLLGRTSGFSVFGGEVKQKRLFGLIKNIRNPVRLVDNEGVIRLRRDDGRVYESDPGSVVEDVKSIMASTIKYGDAGEDLPGLIVICGGKIVDLSRLATLEQMVSLLMIETEGLKKDGSAVILSTGS